MKLILFILIAITVFATPGLCQDSEGAGVIKVIEGTIVSIDWVGSVIVINDVRISVTSDTKIYKGEDAVSFSEIHDGDSARVRYYTDASGNLKAEIINVEYSGDFAV